MPFPTLPDFEVRPENFYVVGISVGDTPSTYAALGQLSSISLSKQHSTRRYQRISIGSKEQYGPATTRLQIAVYLAGNLSDLMKILGKDETDYTDVEIELDPDQIVHLAIDGYNGTGASATVVQQLKVKKVKGLSISGSLNPNGPSQIQFSAGAEDYVVIPNPSAALVTA